MGMIGNAPVAGTIGTGNIQDGGVETADIKDGAVTTAKHADLSVTNAKMAAGAAVANIGYTPVNKAGDTMSGNLKVQVFGNATSSVQYGNGLEAKMGAYAAETNVELPSPSAMFKIRARAGAADTLGLTATHSSTERDGLLVDHLGRVSVPQGQIKFPATQNASSDANTLDDYEEGTFNIFLSDAFSGGNAYSVPADYVKIGRIVHIRFATYAQIMATWTGANDVFLRGLPFITVGEGCAGVLMLNDSTGDGIPLYAWQPSGVGYLKVKRKNFVSAFTASTLPTGGTIMYGNLTYQTNT